MEKPTFEIPDRETVEGLGDFLVISNLSKQISESAISASEIAKRLENDSLSDQERNELGERLTTLVNQGFELSEKRFKVWSKYQ